MVRVVFESPHLSLTHDVAKGLVRYQRTSTPLGSVADLRALNDDVTRALSKIGNTADLKLIVDTRDAPPRNDEAFEAEITRAMGAFLPRFARFALLMKSAVGVLQTQRLGRQSGTALPVFTSEAEALAHLGVDP